MNDRLFVAVIGERDAGKSTTWNQLFGKKIKTGKRSRPLTLNPSEAASVRLINGSNEERRRYLAEVLGREVEIFVVSGSHEEKKRYARKVLKSVDSRIVLCSVQYVDEAFARTWDYVFANGFTIYAQWLNPGHQGREIHDSLGLVNRLLAHGAIVSIRDGRDSAVLLQQRVEEIRQFVHGWAAPRGLLKQRDTPTGSQKMSARARSSDTLFKKL